MISKSFIAQLKTSCDITDIVSTYVPLKRSGRHLKGLCPFHLEKTPSFVVYEETESFYCFGCGAGGDSVTFIMQIENLDYYDAIRFLAERIGMEIPDEEGDQLLKKKARIYQMNKLAARYFHQMLKKPEGKKGLAYFKERKLTQQTIVRYGLGYAGDGWSGLLDYLRVRGYQDKEILEANLSSKSKEGYYFDRFRGRVMFPIIDLRGNVIAFGGRVLDDRKPKYLNSSDTPVFKKSHHLFSLNFAKNSGQKTLILGEGYMDVIAMYQAGFQNAVATLGTALTTDQARLISRYSDDVVIAYDSDEAGIAATTKASNLFENAGIEARVLEIEGAKDPDEYIKKFGAGRFQLLVEQAQSVMSARGSRLKKKYDLDDPDEKVKYIQEYCQIISKMYDAVQRDVFIGKLAQESNTPKEILDKKVKSMRRMDKKRKNEVEWKRDVSQFRSVEDKINPDSTKYRKANFAEEGILYFLYHNPDSCEQIKQKAPPTSFFTAFHQKIYEKLLQAIEDGIPIDIGIFNANFTPQEVGKIASVLNNAQRHSNDPKYLEDCIYSLLEQKDTLNTEMRRNLTLEELEARRLAQRQKKGDHNDKS